MNTEPTNTPTPATVPDGYLLVERSIWTEEQVAAAAGCITRLKNVPGLSDRDLAMSALDAAQVLTPVVSTHVDPCDWTDQQVLDFLGIALRNVDLQGEVRLSEIRQGFELMRDRTAPGCSPVAPSPSETSEVSRLTDEVSKLRNLLALRNESELPAKLNFPTALRKMWSGGEVQEWLDQQVPLFTRPAPAEIGQLRKEAESYKQHTLNAAITIGQICQALEIDDHSEPDMIVEAARELKAESKAVREHLVPAIPMLLDDEPGNPDIHIQALRDLLTDSHVLHCDHQFTDDGQHLLVCTECGYQEDHDPHWRPMETAPTDGTLVRLLVEFEENSTEDDQEAPTIGHNSFKNTGEDEWQFAGWNWQQDCYTSGQGTPIGWLPMIETKGGAK